MKGQLYIAVYWMKKARRAAIHGVAELDTTEWLNWTEMSEE